MTTETEISQLDVDVARREYELAKDQYEQQNRLTPKQQGTVGRLYQLMWEKRRALSKIQKAFRRAKEASKVRDQHEMLVDQRAKDTKAAEARKTKVKREAYTKSYKRGARR